MGFFCSSGVVLQSAAPAQLQSSLLRTLMEFSFTLLKAAGADLGSQQLNNSLTSKIFHFESLVHWMRDPKTPISPALLNQVRDTPRKSVAYWVLN
jgi:hypothetical protein